MNSAGLKAKTKLRVAPAWKLQFTDDYSQVAHFLEKLQGITNCSTSAAYNFGLVISSEKTVVLYQHSSRLSNLMTSVFMGNKKLGVAQEFTYLGSVITSTPF